MEISTHFMRSLNHALTLVTAGCLTAFLWCFFRLPDNNLLVVTNAFQLTNVLYDVSGWHRRAVLAAVTTFAGAMLQLVIAVFANQRAGLLIATGGAIYLLLRLLKNRQCAAVALIVGTLGFTAEAGVLPAVNRAVNLIVSLSAVMAANSLVGLVHLRGNYQQIFPGGFLKTESVRLTVMMISGIILMKVTQMPQGIWIVLTIAMLCIGSGQQMSVKKLALLRIGGSAAGLIFAFFFLGCFTYFNAPVLYLFPLIGGIGYFISYYSGNYFIFSMLFVMTFSIYADFSAGTASAFPLYQTFWARTAATAVGAGVMLFFDRFLLPEKGA